MAANIGYAPDTPSGTSAIRLGDQDIRSFKTSIQQALDSEHSFPAASDTQERGRHTPNASRVSYGNVASVPLIAPSDMSGVMYQETTGNRRMWNFPTGVSNQSNMVGGWRHLQGDANPQADSHLVISAFTGASGSSLSFGARGGTNPGTVVYGGIPYVVATALIPGATAVFAVVSSIGTLDVIVDTFTDAGVDTSGDTVTVFSYGTVAL